uniref:Uncharacterized protein n=1 Tax=Moniliophthora roreri TaxID=221103 RepID=A0A0W0FTH3_MONRR
MDPFTVALEPKPSSSTTLSLSMKATSHPQNQKLKRSSQSPYKRPNLTAKVKRNKFSEICGPYSPDTPELDNTETLTPPPSHPSPEPPAHTPTPPPEPPAAQPLDQLQPPHMPSPFPDISMIDPWILNATPPGHVSIGSSDPNSGPSSDSTAGR